MNRAITLCTLCAILLLAPGKAEAQLLKKLGKAVNEVSNVLGNKNNKNGNSKTREKESSDDSENNYETGNDSNGDEWVFVSSYANKLKKGLLVSKTYDAEKYFKGYDITPATKTIYHDGYTAKPIVGPFSDGMAIARSGQQHFFINASGEKIMPEIQFVMADHDNTERWPRFEKGRFLAMTAEGPVIFDKQGKVVKRFGKGYTAASGFKNGTGMLLKYLPQERIKGLRNKEMVFIDTEGNTIGKGIVGNYSNGTISLLNELKDGRRACILYNQASDEERIGFLDESNNVVIPGQFVRAHDFHEGLAAVQQKDESGSLKWGFIDTQGKLVIGLNYSKEPTDFYGGRALIESKDGKKAVIDKNGNITGRWDDVTPFTVDGYAITTEKDNCDGITRSVMLSVDSSGKKYSYFNPKDTYIGKYLVTDEPGILYCPIHLHPDMYEMVKLPSLESTFEMIRYPFSPEGLTVVPDGVINDKGVYVVIFKENEF